MSQRKQAKVKLLSIGKAIESTSDAIAIMDITGQSVYHNAAFINLFEYTVEQLIITGGLPALYVNLTEAPSVFLTVKSGSSWQGEITIQSRRGRTMQIVLCIDVIKDENEKIIGFIGIHTDFTERKRAEKELRCSEAKYRELAQRETLLNQLANQIRSSLDLNTILETAVQEIRNLLNIDRCFFLWYRPDPKTPVWEFVQEARSSAFPSIIGYRVSVKKFGLHSKNTMVAGNARIELRYHFCLNIVIY